MMRVLNSAEVAVWNATYKRWRKELTREDRLELEELKDKYDTLMNKADEPKIVEALFKAHMNGWKYDG